ncbi:PAS domain-containing protein, partial [Salmonella enterica]|uniref:PAS domain-containing protein n=1 Tax=Salmonella enterica TaxID=28901 RepID=UPI00288E9E54|nr:histidine kinase [Salmonella enterica subsp. enterica serovar Oslo]
IVSVGYLTSYLDSITLTKVINIFIAAVLLLIALFIFSWYFTRSIKKQIFSLEPREIGLLVRQQKAMMESIFEGVIVIDRQRRIEVINHAARSLLGLSQPARPDDAIRRIRLFGGTLILRQPLSDGMRRLQCFRRGR